MRGMLAVFLLNIKSVKMGGILSEGMILCACSPEKIEIIIPPPRVTVGERVVVKGYPGRNLAKFMCGFSLFKEKWYGTNISCNYFYISMGANIESKVVFMSTSEQ